MAITLDFYKEFRLPKPVCGLVSKFISPEVVKRQETESYYSYHLHTDLKCVYSGKATALEPGLYWVLNVCKPLDVLEWYQYLFVITEDGSFYPVAEYLCQADSTWILKASPIIKKYFDGDPLEPIEITLINPHKPRKTRWDQVSR